MRISDWSSDVCSSDLINPLIQNLRRGGIQASARLVDPAQGTNRLRSFDFDLVHTGLLNFYPPNVDLTSRWSSEYAGVQGSEHYNGLKDPVMDELLTSIEKADSRDTLRTQIGKETVRERVGKEG